MRCETPGDIGDAAGGDWVRLFLIECLDGAAAAVEPGQAESRYPGAAPPYRRVYWPITSSWYRMPPPLGVKPPRVSSSARPRPCATPRSRHPYPHDHP